ncbi:protein HOTHEAD-like [Impatiens glandulifera]|uniref:protein HOTHEAD-like n=1 Tax=Impatiens glandulifera TaxID=253017 RepID=UPI001FB14400|nr:protein HOTHEAD-like [Impatiens glandulifera]
MATSSSTSVFKLIIRATLLPLLLFLDSSSADKAPYYTFAKDATSAPTTAFYDYIIIGGGTSGCALAATLSEGANVLLLERGEMPYGIPSINHIESFANTLANLSPTSPSQTFISTDGVINSRARVLGGGTCLNAGFYTRANPEFLNRVGWEPQLVKESYEWIERKLVFEPSILQWQSAVRDGLLEAGVGPYNGFTYDHIIGTKVGGTIFDQNGRRHTAANLLEYADPHRLTLHLNANVHQILFNENGKINPMGYGVLYKDSRGNIHKALLNKGAMNEIILSAGALGSPQLLMLSGIGPKAHLMDHGIKVILDSPLVGEGMSDNPTNVVVVPSPRPVEVSLVQIVGITPFGSFIESASGVQFGVKLPSLTDYIALMNNTDQPTTILPEQIPPFFNAASRSGIILEKVNGPLSTGHLELESTDAYVNPKVTFNYFKDPQDLEKCVKGLETIIRVLESKAMSSFRYPFVTVQALFDMMLTLPVNLRPRHLSSSFSLEQYCKDTVTTLWHYHGGCQVGKVVDRDYKVIGVNGLRVIDGSTFLESPGTNPQATVMMMGRYMGQKILNGRQAKK